jgi:ABC-type dipeptide/oligopeptide/nickel transport system permease subunit
VIGDPPLEPLGGEEEIVTAAESRRLVNGGRNWSGAGRTAWAGLRRRPGALFSLPIVVAWAVVIIFAPFLAPHGPLAVSSSLLQPPGAAHPFGTDEIGRDVLSRVMYGGRVSVPAALVVVAFSLVLGSCIGLLTGYRRGWVDDVLMRATDVFLAFPLILLAMAVGASLGTGIVNGIIALSVVTWPQYARVTRSVTLELRQREFVLASTVAGRRTASILLRVVFPNVFPTLFVMASVDVGRAIVNFSVLSFIGLASQPPTAEWGSMVADGSQYPSQWWMSAFPGLAIFSLVIAFNFLGDWLRDLLDPYMHVRKVT